MPVEIVYGLWVGNKKDAFDMAFLKNRNINIIINVTTEVPFIEEEDGDKISIEKIRIPVSDNFKDGDDYMKWNNELFNHFEQITNYIEKNLSKQKNILVHCNQGKYRSTAIIIAYLMKKLNKFSLEEIYTIFTSKYFIKNLDRHLFKNSLLEFDKKRKILFTF